MEPGYTYSDRVSPPMEHQLHTLNRILEDGGVHVLAHDVGTGKTRVTIDYACLVAYAAWHTGKGPVKVLVVCPRDVQATWLQQLRIWAPEQTHIWAEIGRGGISDKATRMRRVFDGEGFRGRIPADRLLYRSHGQRTPLDGDGPRLTVFIVNYETFALTRTDRGVSSITLGDRMVNAVKASKPQLLIADELHRVRGATSNTSKTLARAARYVPRRLGLTGTMLPHSPLDAYGQMRIIDPEVFADSDQRPWSWGRFKERYCELDFWGAPKNFKNLDDLQDRLATRCSVVEKSAAHDLPTREIEHLIDLTPDEQAAYEQMREELLAALANGSLVTAPNRLTQMLRLRQIAAGYLGGPEGVQHIGPGHRARCKSLLEDLLASERRVVVFAWGRPEVDTLAEELRADPPHSAEVWSVTGDTPDRQRAEYRAMFGDRNDSRRMVLIIQSSTMTTGINELVTANQMIFLSLSQKREDLIQAKGRIDRPGQTSACTFHYVLARDTIDEVVLTTLRERGDLEAACLAHIKGNG